MNDLTQIGFDYAALPVDLSVSLKLHADRFVAVRNRAAYEMGKEIYEAQQELASHDKTQGQFGAWVESLGITRQTGYDLITLFQGVGSDVVKLFDNKKLSQTVSVMLLRSPDSVVQQALEKAESGEKVTVADVKDWKSELEAERQARLVAEQRSKEWNEQYIKERDEKLAAEQKVLTLESQPKPEPEVIEKEVVPADYESAKQQAATLQAQTEALQTQTAILKKELENLQTQQAKLVSDQVKTKLQGYQNEVDDMDRKKSIMQEQVDRMKEYMASLNSESKRLEVHQDVIEKSRLHLISLAAFLSDSDEMNDKDTRDRWLRLSNMHNDAHKAILNYLGLGSSSDRLVV